VPRQDRESQATLDIVPVPMLADNYAYLIHEPMSGRTAILDPSESGPVLRAAAEQGWRITDILNTHHHGDHCGGNLGIKQATGAIIAGPAYDRARIPGIDIAVDEASGYSLGAAQAQVLFIPGHTKGHIAFYFPRSAALFCGDTLFSMGCGRIFEGTPVQMWNSLQKLNVLPDKTWIYCGHEYTEANCRFARMIDPENRDLALYAQAAVKARERGLPTVPSTLAVERAANPFLRAGESDLKAALGMTGQSDAAVFAEIRRRKDLF